jgi:hypothetical protein
MVATVRDGVVHLFQRGVDLGRAVRVVELVHRLAEPLAVVTGLVRLGGAGDSFSIADSGAIMRPTARPHIGRPP